MSKSKPASSSMKTPKPAHSQQDIKANKADPSRSVLGWVFLTAGAFFLLNTLTGYGAIRFWPFLLIAAGAIFMWQGVKREA